MSMAPTHAPPGWSGALSDMPVDDGCDEIHADTIGPWQGVGRGPAGHPLAQGAASGDPLPLTMNLS
jgi:hypothetical protein